MSEKSTIVGPGRPEKFGPVHIRFFKKIVGKLGLIRGRNFLLENGIKINNKVRKLEISVPTLSKYVRRSDELTGEGVVLCSRSQMKPAVHLTKKVNTAAEDIVRRGPGRPKKVNTVAEDVVRRGPGRPKKVNTVTEDVVRRGPGRPKKVSTIIKVGSGRGPGRPKKSA